MGLDRVDNPNMIAMETEEAESWFAGLWRAGESRTTSSEVTADSLQPALTEAKESPILTLEMGEAQT